MSETNLDLSWSEAVLIINELLNSYVTDLESDPNLQESYVHDQKTKAENAWRRILRG